MERNKVHCRRQIQKGNSGGWIARVYFFSYFFQLGMDKVRVLFKVIRCWLASFNNILHHSTSPLLMCTSGMYVCMHAAPRDFDLGVSNTHIFCFVERSKSSKSDYFARGFNGKREET